MQKKILEEIPNPKQLFEGYIFFVCFGRFFSFVCFAFSSLYFFYFVCLCITYIIQYIIKESKGNTKQKNLTGKNPPNLKF